MAIFSIDCTLPPHSTTFVQLPNARGTLDIVYSCLAVIVLCTWSILHLNVPTQIHPVRKRQKLMLKMSRTYTKLKWMALNILAPEWPFAQAVCGRISEHQLQKTFNNYRTCDGVPWKGSHTQLANMGGFVIRFGEELLGSTIPDQVAGKDRDGRCVVDGYYYNRR
jgi:hypothetical protein